MTFKWRFRGRSTAAKRPPHPPEVEGSNPAATGTLGETGATTIGIVALSITTLSIKDLFILSALRAYLHTQHKGLIYTLSIMTLRLNDTQRNNTFYQLAM